MLASGGDGKYILPTGAHIQKKFGGGMFWDRLLCLFFIGKATYLISFELLI